MKSFSSSALPSDLSAVTLATGKPIQALVSSFSGMSSMRSWLSCKLLGPWPMELESRISASMTLLRAMEPGAFSNVVSSPLGTRMARAR